MAGPPECLQYFTATSGTVARYLLVFFINDILYDFHNFLHYSFNFPTDQSSVGSTSKISLSAELFLYIIHMIFNTTIQFFLQQLI